MMIRMPKLNQEFHFSHIFLFRMVALIFIGFGLLWFSSEVKAGEVSLAWDPPSSEYGGFILSYGSTSGSYTNNQDVGVQTTYTVSNLDPGRTYFFAVKAYDESHGNESQYSNQVSATVPEIDSTPPAPPKGVRISKGN